MNILASWKWLGEWVDLEGLTPEAVAARVSLSGPGIEKLIPQDESLKGIVLGRIEAVEPHPQADRLRVTKVDVGVGTLGIVCGGSNVEVGQWVPVAKIGAWVRWHGEGDPVELKPTEIRGVASEGMICAANEVGLSEAFPHGEKEILDLGKALPEAVASFRAGQPLAEALGMAGDILMDTEITTNRPDAMGMEGFSREVAAILERPWNPATTPEIAPGAETLSVAVAASASERPLCGRFCAVKIDGIKMGPSPWWMRRRLLAAGLRPINAIVDITNYVLLEMAQPMHAYDAAKLEGGLTVATATADEAFEALDAKTYALQPSMLTIRDAAGPVAVAGVIGGQRAAVGETTTSVLFEAATFDAVSIRRTARALELSTDASKLFEKGLSVEAPLRALARAVELCLQVVGGTVVSRIADVRSSPYAPATFVLRAEEATRLIGVEIPVASMRSTLERLGFTVATEGEALRVTVPWWRDQDIEDARDLVEEIARVYGYANLPTVFPTTVSGTPSEPIFGLEDKVRDLCKGFGFTELMGYSFVSRDQLERAGILPEMCVRLLNPLSQDAEFMRPSLAPSVLQALVDNQERADALRVFELSHVYWPFEGRALPEEATELLLAIRDKASESWNEAKGVAEVLLAELGIREGAWKRWEGDHFWHPGRSLQYWVGDRAILTVGELHPQQAEAWKIEGRVGLVHGFAEILLSYVNASKAYRPLPAFPEVSRDLAVVVVEAVEIATVEAAMRGAATDGLLADVAWFDTYRGQGLEGGKKSLAFRLVFRSAERTLASEEVDRTLEAVRQALVAKVGAEFRS